ncbi:ankyrin repeat protein [Viridothelium virens]|uniref:Ankyrin repeat protein n=1 Tax=Viridothelium virens TaxID=1048519 RepID=A0A6A6H6B6_VIRVR|nr:ankyrin repeat protein [Viridothelium virens]
MASNTPTALPAVPAKHEDFITFVDIDPNAPLREQVEPYKRYDAKLREIFAQEPSHPILADSALNLTPILNGHEHEIKIRARDLGSEAIDEKEKYIMPLSDEDRKMNGSPAIVPSLKDFQTNFNVFSEQSLVDLDWSNVLAAGSSVVTALLPVPDAYKSSKKGLRKYYHEVVAPASDVDLFLYGLNEQQAIEKIKQIEQCVKGALLAETTTVRTKNAITIASQYPTRHVQIVLRIYKSIAEILTGFDVDCSCAAYDGKQVWAAPRALTAFMTQVNTIDLSRRSPSYENRLSKYSHRGFEVYWPDLDRSKIDPTIFERSFSGTVGLARLLVLEKLPSQSAREAYQDERRVERGRPALNRYRRARHLPGNVKEKHEDEVAEWVEGDEVSNYHTFTVPYGPKYNAKKIEKLLYTKDLLLNAEWNNEDRLREVNLHRHPAFFGTFKDVIGDCCGFCPKPCSPEEEKVAEEESSKFVSGSISFIKDNPGRQAIGSFNPITDDDWTGMAYVGNTARLCQAIVDGDLAVVSEWLSQGGSDSNIRDHTGRTPLQLAVQSSTPEIVKCLVDHGARLIARLADGRTALHLACAQGNLEMVRILLERSEENEAQHAEEEDLRKNLHAMTKPAGTDVSCAGQEGEEDAEMVDAEEADGVERTENSDEDVEMKSATSVTSTSFVKVEQKRKQVENDHLSVQDHKDEPDVYDINVLAWDVACSPLHLAIAQGHIAVVKELVQRFAADVLLPVKLFNDYDKSARAAILTLVLALNLPFGETKDMALALLQLGASSAQADMKQTTAFHYYVADKSEAIEALFDSDELGVRRAINHLSAGERFYGAEAASPLVTAIAVQEPGRAFRLLEAGARPTIDFATYMKATQIQYDNFFSHYSSKEHRDRFNELITQPIVLAVETEQPAVALELLRRGSDPNTLTCDGYDVISHDWSRNWKQGQSLLDLVEEKLKQLYRYKGEDLPSPPSRVFWNDESAYFQGLEEGTYKFWAVRTRFDALKRRYRESLKSFEKTLKEAQARKGLEEKLSAIRALVAGFEEVKNELEDHGAKKFSELHPGINAPQNEDNEPERSSKSDEFKVEFDFDVPDLTDETKEAYLRIFQAAWEGDLSTIKSFTLGPWGWGLVKDQSPLKVAVRDSHEGFSPFSLAVLKGHMNTAEGILEIVQSQFEPRGLPKTRYNMDEESNDECESNDSYDSDDQINVASQRIHDDFTIENIGEIETEAKSDIPPIRLFAWSCEVAELVGKEVMASDPIEYAVESDDRELLTTLLDLANLYAHRNASEDHSKFFDVPTSVLNLCIREGRTHLLAELISHTGCGVSLDDLMEMTGTTIREKQKYYQGLTVYGSKRKDWANAARGVREPSSTRARSPILEAAFQGNLDSVKWLLSDVPVRCYNKFAAAHADDKRIIALNKADGGFQKAISQFLNTRIELILHCAVLSEPKPESIRLLQYLVEAFPKSLEAKSSSGSTPLHLAFRLHRHSFARILIEAGADQTARDNQGANVLHVLLDLNRGYLYRECAKDVKRMMALIDPRLRASLSTERVACDPGSLTPLAQWIDHGPKGEDGGAAVLREILDFPGQDDHLLILNGAGKSPLHMLTDNSCVDLMRILLERNPLLVYRENATGRTPAEEAEDACTARKFSDPPNIPTTGQYHDKMVDKRPELFLEDSNEKLNKTRSEDSCHAAMALCKEVMEKHPGKRRLVTLHEANEVAKRLAARQARFPRAVSEESHDEVDELFDTAAKWNEEGLKEEDGEED